MGVISAVRRMLARRTIPQPVGDHPFSFSFFQRPESGVVVTPLQAFTYAVVFSCIDLITGALSSLPWHVMKDRSDGGTDRASLHPAERLLNRMANPDMSSVHWRETMLHHALLWGNGYSEIERDRSERVVGLWPLNPESVTPTRDAKGDLVYEVRQQSGDTEVLFRHDVFHLRGLAFDGLVGYSPVQLGARSIGLGIAEDKYASTFFGNGAWPGGFIKPSQDLDEKTRKQWLESFEQRHKGSDKAHKIGLLPNGAEWIAATIPNDQSELSEARRHQLLEVCRLFRVPPHKIFELSHATFSNITEQNIEFVQYQMPWIRRMEQEADMKLTSVSAPGLFTKINVSAAMRADPDRRSKYYEVMSRLGVLSINEIRDLEDLNPIGKEGEARFVAVNMQTLERAINPPEPVAPPPPFGGEDKPDDAEEGDDKKADDAKADDSTNGEEDGDLGVRTFMEDSIRRVFRKEVYAVRDVIKRVDGNDVAYAEEMGKFVDRHRKDLATRLTLPCETWLTLHGYKANGIAGEVASATAGQYAIRESVALLNPSAGVEDRLESEDRRVEELRNRLIWGLENALSEIS